MKRSINSFVAFFILLLAVVSVEAGTKVVIEVEIIKGDNIEKSTEIITFDEKRFRLDLPGSDEINAPETPYIMTVDGGENWVIGDRPKDRFYCSQMQTEEFFKNMGTQVTDAIEFFNVKADAPTVKKVLEEPGPEIQGFKTTHLQLETNARAHAWFLFIKFEYTVKIIDDIWYTTEVNIHPVKKRWMNALSQSGNSLIDQLIDGFTSKLEGPILKQETVIQITDARKKETKIQTHRANIVEIIELKRTELDEIFQLPECETMDDDEVQEKAKALFSAGKIML